ncbi:putative purine permease YwdJ [Methanocorpusculaceae archaeon Sp1]|nr:putative purine permease YwdJ [Methanocorpusculaceae archaeon Sp1]
MSFRYNVNDKVPAKEMATSGLMWTICSAAFVIIFANVVAGLYQADPSETVWYAQKLLVITGAAVILQVMFGHKLPVVFGPSAILLTAAVASTDFAPAAFSTALVLCGVLGIVIAQTGLLGLLAKLFTPRVIGTVLTLIPLTLVPTFVSLIANPSQPGSQAGKVIFAFVLLIVIFAANHRLRGFWRATLMLWMLIFGTVAALVCFPGTMLSFGAEGAVPLTEGLLFSPLVAPGVIISVFICYVALIVNDVGSIRGVAAVAKSPASEIKGQLRRGITITGIANILSGGAGVIGGVNYSISTGMIQDTKNASRYPLLIAGVVMIICATIPQVIALISSIPTVVTGCLLIFIMTSQLSAALGILIDHAESAPFTFDNGVVIGFAVIIAATFSFLPEAAVAAIPAVIRPVLANGFVAGTIAVMVLEHVVFREKKRR